MNAAIRTRPYAGLPWSLRFKVLAALLVAGLLIWLLGVKLLSQPASITVVVQGGHATVGAAAPAFTSKTLDGASVQLSQYRGKPVLLNFWATWCAPCKDEMPLIQHASSTYKTQGLTVLAVNYQETNRTSMAAFMRNVGARFPAVFDPAGQIASEYGVNVGLPVSIFIDRSGKVSFIQVGQMSNAVLQQHLQPIL
jgi:DsbE subfamily thiol:disulfide oxidoreductase